MSKKIPMERALIVKKCWLELIFARLKVWEMRSCRTNIRGLVGLIESGSGLIVGQVEIVDSLEPLPSSGYDDFFDRHRVSSHLESLQNKYRHPWVLQNARKYQEPIRYSHPKGAVIWVKLDSKTSNLCLAA